MDFNFDESYAPQSLFTFGPQEPWFNFGEDVLHFKYASEQSLVQAPLETHSTLKRKGDGLVAQSLATGSGNDSLLSNIELRVETQPPVEVRTRTPSENRTFSCAVSVYGNLSALQVKALRVSLVYARDNRTNASSAVSGASTQSSHTQLQGATRSLSRLLGWSERERERDPDREEASSDAPNQRILGGTKEVDLSHYSDKQSGVVSVRFSNLSLSEGSTKHDEREFQLQFVIVTQDGKHITTPYYTNSFYAFSNKKVLSRRKNLTIRCLSRSHGDFSGGEQLHIIGKPFIPGPSFDIVLSTAYGELHALDVEIYSESVVFFTLPPLPFDLHESTLTASVRVTNDGRNYSNAIEFSYSRDRVVAVAL